MDTVELKVKCAKYPDNMLVYNYTADEIDGSPELYPSIREWAYNLRGANIKQMLVMSPIPELPDWSHSCLVHDPYSPIWLVDFAPINFRIMHGLINQQLGLSGSLYWCVDFKAYWFIAAVDFKQWSKVPDVLMKVRNVLDEMHSRK